MVYPWAIQSEKLMRENYTIQGLNSEVFFFGKREKSTKSYISRIKMEGRRGDVKR